MSARRVRAAVALPLLAAASALAALAALGWGASAAGWPELVAALAGRAEEPARTILLEVRLPRIVLAAIVGAALSAAGSAFQGVLRNPLADPYVLGVSGGAALGAVLASAAGATGALARPLAAFAGALLTLVALFAIARAGGRTGSLALLLTGVVVNAIDAALVLFLVSAGDPRRFQEVLFFLIGSLEAQPWSVVASVGLLVAVGTAALLLLSHRITLLSAGEETAAQLGVDVERTVWLGLGAASLVTAAAVAFTGIIGFVGLIVPHAMRGLVGPDHRVLVPASAVAGAGFLVLADAGARVAMAPLELPVGVVTALLGGPFFLVLFRRRLRDG